jgi:hypothetical protein
MASECRDAEHEWRPEELAALEAVNAELRRRFPGAYSGLEDIDGRPPQVVDEPARLVGAFPDTEVQVTYTYWGRQHTRGENVWTQNAAGDWIARHPTGLVANDLLNVNVRT